MIKQLTIVAALAVLVCAGSYETGFEAYENGDMKTAVKHWGKAAAKGELKSQTMLGLLYFRGDEITPDYKKAADMLSKVFAANDETLHITVSFLYYKNRGESAEDLKALRLFEEAIDKEGPNAQYNLGMLFATGTGVDKDMKKAAGLIKKAKEGGSAKAKKAWTEYKLGRY